MNWPTSEGTFKFGNLRVQSGDTLDDAKIVWKTYGTLSAQKNNVVLYPTSYSAVHTELDWLIGPDGVLDPSRWFIVIPNMFGNGLSSSPSNTKRYPELITSWDNIHAQHRFLQEEFGVDEIACVYGWSMGAQQAYHWAAIYPEQVHRAVINCGSARTAIHNQVFLAGLMAILESAPEYEGSGMFSSEPKRALTAFARVYAGWALSQDFYRAKLHLTRFDAPDLEAYLRANWEGRFGQLRAANLYAQLRTWFFGDISANDLYNGNLDRALRAIKARMLLLPAATDLYFRVADNEAELPFLSSAELSPIPSIWGHRAGNPVQNPEDLAFIRTKVKGLLDEKG